MAEIVDVVVIGMGPGGEAAAGELAEAGLSVVGIDARLVGGECPYYGCIPSKMMIRAGNSLAEGHRIRGLAGDADIRPDWAPVAERIRTEATDNWDDTVAVERFTGKGGQFVRGRGTITGPRTVTAAGREFTVRRAIVINTGTEPAVPPIPGLADVPYWTNREAIAATEIPESLIVIGGGAIGAELAQAFARFGTRVTVLEAAPSLLPPEEPEAGKLLAEVFDEEGIDVQIGARIENVHYSEGTFALNVGGSTLTASRLLVATGRTTNLGALGVAALGLDPAARFLTPDTHMRVADGVYAIGDITGKGAFTHISMYQGAIAAAHILGREPEPAQYHAVPRVTFTDPEIGSVGLSEAQAREEGLNVRVGFTDLATSARGWLHKSGNQGFIKLVEDADRGVLVGAASAGPTGGEVLSALTLAVHARIPVGTLRRMIYAYPTFHRAIEDALNRLE
ncbi:pyruvate/2-oxoglutarate dehydrogenase complex dihydrolipoamide dehydrogenase (E3) component [Arthrobacter silviterrae]|uniref:NAD(P)/FAD-dependent oxidoreductase n=1 Tax=Arthrobacter silviterrae TaxID=2026658 RepID=A0ABX0DHF5_9MICC|nr:NAD(P)/FAD-dependent oxidoreductase [Arthrobacter silviterrae]MDQ0278823.1 pyruvate/2-oxoglutarate dehydrogenase complex dihydrolipoamide dehydrogenase (E3) component [Arthrobacter silviterrae]NGN83990.1 NAD(P)/FAD-dependent oxidoreductase [Arthrobacter silviterrae]